MVIFSSSQKVKIQFVEVSKKNRNEIRKHDEHRKLQKKIICRKSTGVDKSSRRVFDKSNREKNEKKISLFKFIILMFHL